MEAVTTEPSARSADDSPDVSDGSARGPAIPSVRSEALFGRAREILIEHCGGYYRLRLTRSNKLILTK
jgi:hemin uptake protein HemP